MNSGIRLRLFAVLASFMLSGLLSARADTLAGNSINPGGGLSSGGYYGQGFTVAGTGAYNDITFSFLSTAGASYATGTGYLFSAPFTGTPFSLASSSYLGSAAASGDVYTFGPSVLLTGGQTYYFYEDGLVPLGAFGINSTTGSSYYFALNSTSSFANFNFTDEFLVTGDPAFAATPEPSSLALLATGVLGFAGIVRRKLA